MSKPTTVIDPIYNGKLISDLDCNNFQLVNLDESNLSGGGGGSGNDTGTTTAILKGDGNHGFADAVPDSDYVTVGSLASKEDQTTHNADIATLTSAVAAANADIAAVEALVALSATSADVTAALALKADDADLTAYITSNDSALAALTTAVGNKADSSSVSSALAGKEPLLPTTANDRYILARRNASGTDAWFFVDPVTLGTTSQSFTDGVENSSTTLTSATANFVAGDVGKTITGDHIPAATTIASRTNSTTIILSAAATSTSSGNNFTILNRLEVGGTGTVTSVGTTNNITDLFSATVTNPTSSATITFDPSSTVGANRFYGNFTGFAGTAAFGTASAARASLGGTTAGQALFQVANPSAISFPQFTALNAAVTRTPAQVLGDIGAESALTFSTPLLRSVSPPNVISIQPATGAQSGYLTNSDWTLFNGKVPGTRTISTTAPLTGGGNLAANLTLAIPAATASVDGYLAQADFQNFTAKPPNSRTIGTTAPLAIGGVIGASLDLSANRTISMLSATSGRDGYLTKESFAAFSAGSPQTVVVNVTSGSFTVAATVPPVARVILTQALTGTLSITLPGAINYNVGSGYPFLEFVDTVQGGAMVNFGITLVASTGGGQDLVDGALSIVLPRGSGYVRLNSDGLSRWTTTKYFVSAFQDPVTPTKKVLIDVSNVAPSTSRVLRVADTAISGTVQEYVRSPSAFLVDYDISSGALTGASVNAFDVVRNVDDILTAGITSKSHTVLPADGTIDTVKLSAGLDDTNSPLTIVWPPAIGYPAGRTVNFLDASNSINSNNTVSIAPTSGNTIKGSSAPFLITQGGVAGGFISNGSSDWAPVGFSSGGAVSPFAFQILDGTGTNINWPAKVGLVDQVALVTMSASKPLVITGQQTGMHFELQVVQPLGGGCQLVLPTGSATPSRTIFDAVLNGSTTMTSATANFTQNDVSRIVTGTGISATTYIATVSNATTVLLNQTATTGTGIKVVINGSGKVNLALGASEITKVTGTTYPFLGGASWFWDASPAMTVATVLTCDQLGDTLGTWSTAAQTGVIVGNLNTRKYIGSKYTVGTSHTICGINIPMWKVGTPPGSLQLLVYDSAGTTPGTNVLAQSSNIIASGSVTAGDNTTGPAAVVSNPLSFSLSTPMMVTNGTVLWVVVVETPLSGSLSTNNYHWLGSGGGGLAISSDGVAWTAQSGLQGNFKTYHTL